MMLSIADDITIVVWWRLWGTELKRALFLGLCRFFFLPRPFAFSRFSPETIC